MSEWIIVLSDQSTWNIITDEVFIAKPTHEEICEMASGVELEDLGYDDCSDGVRKWQDIPKASLNSFIHVFNTMGIEVRSIKEDYYKQ